MTITLTVRAQLLAAALSVTVAMLTPGEASAQIATGQSKFLGSTIQSSVPSNWTKYWNQVTPENSGKWGSVEATQGVFDWSQLDIAYNFAQQNGFKFKDHNLIWGAQFPSWITSLSQAQQLTEIQKWITMVGQRYPKTWAVDVVNEPIHTQPPFMAALGGAGSTGWDWVINSFQMARTAFPNSKLLINEFGTEQEPTTRQTYLQIIALLKARGLIDGVGVQGHYFNLDNMSASDMKTALDSYATSGLPIYISELDITGGGTDAGQLAKYQEVFPVIWNHPDVQGVTTWFYIVGQTWHTGTGLVNTDGTERPAMTWLKGFVAGNNPPPPPPPPPPGNCHIAYSVTQQWNSGFLVAITINNTSTTAINGWTLTWSFGNGQTVVSLWNGAETQSGSNVTVKNLSYNASIPAGGSYSMMGFQGAWNGVTNTAPTAFSLNGTACN